MTSHQAMVEKLLRVGQAAGRTSSPKPIRTLLPDMAALRSASHAPVRRDMLELRPASNASRSTVAPGFRDRRFRAHLTHR